MLKNKWYDTPTQVIFIPQGECPCAGIAYHDEVICGCCGGVFCMDEVLIVKEYPWETLHDAIIGGDQDFDEAYEEWNKMDEDGLYDKWDAEFATAQEAEV